MEEEEKEERSIANTSVINHDGDLWEKIKLTLL